MADISLCTKAPSCPIKHRCRRNGELHTEKHPRQAHMALGPAVKNRDGNWQCENLLDAEGWDTYVRII